MQALKHNMSINTTALTFCFSKIAGCTRDKYFVEVIHEDHLVTTFDMLKEEGNRWKILPPAREWVKEREETFESIVNQHEREGKLYNKIQAGFIQ